MKAIELIFFSFLWQVENTSVVLKDQVRGRENSSQRALVGVSGVGHSSWTRQGYSVFLFYFYCLNQMGHEASENGVKLFFELAAHLWGFSFIVLYCPCFAWEFLLLLFWLWSVSSLCAALQLAAAVFPRESCISVLSCGYSMWSTVMNGTIKM